MKTQVIPLRTLNFLLEHKTIEQPKESQSGPCFTASYSLHKMT